MSNLSQISKYSEKHKYFTTDCGWKILCVIKNIVLCKPISCLVGSYSILEYFLPVSWYFQANIPNNF